MNPFSMQIEYWSRNETSWCEIHFGRKTIGWKKLPLMEVKSFCRNFQFSVWEKIFQQKSPIPPKKKKPFKLKSKSKNIETVSLESKNAHWKEKTWQFTSIWMMTKKKRKRKKLLHWLEGQAKEARSWALREDLKKLSKP